MFSCRGSRESISFSRSDFSSLFDARRDDCNHAHIGERVNPVESPNVATNFVDCVLDKLVMKSRYKSSLPKSSILIVPYFLMNKIREVMQGANAGGRARRNCGATEPQVRSVKNGRFLQASTNLRIVYGLIIFCNWYVIGNWHEKLRNSHFQLLSLLAHVHVA